MHNINLRYFYQVGRTGSLTAAAERLNVAVSAVSRQILNLETETGVALFERRARGMALTAAGEILMGYARRNFLELEQVMAEMKGIHAIGQRVVTLASSEGFAWDLMPAVIARFRGSYPGIQFKLHVVSASKASKMVIDGDADLAITYSLSPVNELAISYHEPAPMFALMRNDHPLATRKLLSLSDLQPYSLALPEEGTTVRQLLDIACSLRSLTLTSVFTSHSLSSIYRFTQLSENIVAPGSFFTMHSRAAEDKMSLIALADAELHQRILQVQTMAGRKLPPAIGAFVDFLVGELRHAKAQQDMREP